MKSVGVVFQDDGWRVVRFYHLYTIEHYCPPPVSKIALHTWSIVGSETHDCFRCGLLAPERLVGMKTFLKWSFKDEENKHV